MLRQLLGRLLQSTMDRNNDRRNYPFKTFTAKLTTCQRKYFTVSEILEQRLKNSCDIYCGFEGGKWGTLPEASDSPGNSYCSNRAPILALMSSHLIFIVLNLSKNCLPYDIY